MDGENWGDFFWKEGRRTRSERVPALERGAKLQTSHNEDLAKTVEVTVY